MTSNNKSLDLINMTNNLRKPFDANVKQGDRVHILTDFKHDPLVWEAASAIVTELGAEPVISLFSPRPADYYDPPESVCSAMLQADINVFLTTTGLFHSQAAHNSMEKGIPSIVMDGGMTAEMFEKGAVEADYLEIAKLKNIVGRKVFGEDAKNVRVTSEYGTDITYSVDGRIFVPPMPKDDYDPFKAYSRSTEGRKKSPLYGTLFPTGEFNVPPVEGSGEGKIVVDISMHQLGLLKEPVSLDISKGRIQNIDGGYQARLLEEYLEEFGDENAYLMPTEASIGINRSTRITGVQREDKNFFGSIHFGLGTNADVGGTIKSKLHMDGVILQPTVIVDSETKIERGRFLVDLL
ncbi:aminopeptidase [Virgibacillus natechei]|uniref:aminopeptidase n=1 Tax=Virgibacillus sp. CBA3643 TaxID=2942278 RepID=UPI0035A32B92